MEVSFIAPDPRRKAQAALNDVLDKGADQIAIACAFLTSGGVEVLRPHAARLQLADSFVVVAWDWPTDRAAVGELHRICPGHVYVHLGAQTPVEKGLGPGLMHSKVFFSRAGNACWLWTGSHNLTASAFLGLNCEAAVRLEGLIDEQPFKDALEHLNRCKAEAIVFDPYNPPPEPKPRDTLVIHAECHVAVSAPPWFVHLRPASTRYDRIMLPPADVWLYLYEPGALQPGAPRPRAKAAYSGTLTALNFTEYHPRQGIPADWRDANHAIEQRDNIFHLIDPSPSSQTPTQCVFRVDTEENPEAVWLTASPVPELERVVGKTWIEEVDPAFLRFFEKRSVKSGALVHRDYQRIRTSYSVPQREVGGLTEYELQSRLGMPDNAEVRIEQTRSKKDKFAFIYRAKYRA